MNPARCLCFLLLVSLPPSLFCSEPTDAFSPDRPRYVLAAEIDYELGTYEGRGDITVPITAGESPQELVFFLYANAEGIGGSDGRRGNIVIDRVSAGGQPVMHSVRGPVLRVPLPENPGRSVRVEIQWRGVVPRMPGNEGGKLGLASTSLDLSQILGGSSGSAESRKKNSDFGLYAYADGIMSLGAFWYPHLAVRKQGKWLDEPPEGLGDVAYSEMGDFEVRLTVPSGVSIAAPGARIREAERSASSRRLSWRFTAPRVRDFAVLVSEDYSHHSRPVEIGGKKIEVESYLTRRHDSHSQRVLDIAAESLKILSRRFGAYPYSRFTVVEGTLQGGAGGMEFSALTAIAPSLFTEWDSLLSSLSGSLNLQGLEQVLGGLLGGGASKAPNPAEVRSPLSELFAQQKDTLDSLLEMTIAHEVAHQWWAIGVGSDSLRAPFVDESLANYSAILYFEDRYGRERAEKMMDLHLKMAYTMGRWLGGGDAPANLPTKAYGSSLQYGAVVYGKGALFYDRLRHEVGDEVFFDTLREYHERYGSRLAEPDSLRKIFRVRAADKGVEALYRRWIEETHGDQDIVAAPLFDLQDMLKKIHSPR